MRKSLVSLLVLAAALGACGGAGSGGAAGPTASIAPTTAPVVGGTDAPKQYPGKTTDPSASPSY